jgi:hypothetical protein
VSKYPVELTDNKYNNAQFNKFSYNELYRNEINQQNLKIEYNNMYRPGQGQDNRFNYRQPNYGSNFNDNNFKPEYVYNRPDENNYSKYYPNNNIPNYIQQNINRNNINYNVIKAEEFINNKRMSFGKSNMCGISPCLANVKINYEEIRPKRLDFTTKKNVIAL